MAGWFLNGERVMQNGFPVIALCLAALPAIGDVRHRPVACDTLSTAPGCVAASELGGFTPLGGMVVLGDRLRLVGIEDRAGDQDRLVIVDLSLPDGAVVAVVPLVGDLPLTVATEFSPDGSLLLVSPEPDWSRMDTDALPPRTLVVFDAEGKEVIRSEGLVVTAIADAFGENRLVFDQESVSLGLTDGDARVEIDLATGAVEDNGLIPDGEWLYNSLFDRRRGWHQDGVVVETDWSRDGSPSSVTLRTADSPVSQMLIGNPPGTYDREFAQPVVSPDGQRLAVLQFADGAPGPILLALGLTDAKVIWRALTHQTNYREVQYRWTDTGALVLLQPHPVFGDTTMLLVHQP
jgi:hypothetical protein